jgi:Protein of unknown function (DUF3027)
MSKGKALINDEHHINTTHERWIQKRNRNPSSPDYQWDKWAGQQCLTCRYYIPLSGSFGADYGACSNAASPFDGTVRFEHDGCDEYSENEDYWNA